MKMKIVALAILTLTIAIFGSVQGKASGQAFVDHYSEAQLKQLARDAHTTEQYTVLASYFGNQQKTFSQKAADEKQEWARRSQFTSSLYAKYPKPADSARNLYEYYAYKASVAAKLSDKYQKLAQPAAQTN